MAKKSNKTYQISFISESNSVDGTFPTIWESKEALRKAIKDQNVDLKDDRQLGNIYGMEKGNLVSATPFRAEGNQLKFGRTKRLEAPAKSEPAVVVGEESPLDFSLSEKVANDEAETTVESAE